MQSNYYIFNLPINLEQLLLRAFEQINGLPARGHKQEAWGYLLHVFQVLYKHCPGFWPYQTDVEKRMMQDWIPFVEGDCKWGNTAPKTAALLWEILSLSNWFVRDYYCLLLQCFSALALFRWRKGLCSQLRECITGRRDCITGRRDTTTSFPDTGLTKKKVK